MLTNTTKNNITPNALLYQFLIDTIKQQCALYNFNPIHISLLEANGSLRTNAYTGIIDAYEHDNHKQTSWNVFTNGPVFEQKNNSVVPRDTFTIAAINTDSVAYHVHVIKMLDTLFSDILKLEDYVLKLVISNYANQEKLFELLSFHSISHIIDQTPTDDAETNKTLRFYFTSKEFNNNNFCSGFVWTHREHVSIGAEIALDAVFLLTQRIANKLQLPQAPALHIIIPEHQAHHVVALFLANELQTHALTTDILMASIPTDQRLTMAQRLGAKYILIIGPDTISSGTIIIKNGLSGIQTSVKQADLVNFLFGR